MAENKLACFLHVANKIIHKEKVIPGMYMIGKCKDNLPMFQNSKCQKALAAITAFQMIDNEYYKAFFVFHIKYISALATKMYL